MNHSLETFVIFPRLMFITSPSSTAEAVQPGTVSVLILGSVSRYSVVTSGTQTLAISSHSIPQHLF